jgi:hypothetical protein
MQVNRGADVILLNSDTVVYGDWAQRLKACVYSRPRIATANPMSNGWMSNYPHRHSNNNEIKLELADDVLDIICKESNNEELVEVYGTIGFCMFIRRDCLNEIGLFDHEKFPLGYGEETDFCYRAGSLGWKHIIAGNVFVRHWENRSFTSEKKAQLVEESFRKFESLHPGHMRDRNLFDKNDPCRRLREKIDIERIKRIYGGRDTLQVTSETATYATRRQHSEELLLLFSEEASNARLVPPKKYVFPNLKSHALPDDIVAFNHLMHELGVKQLCFPSASLQSKFLEMVRAKPFEVSLEPSTCSKRN